MYTTIIDSTELMKHLNDPNWVIVDCRFSLDNVERGRRDYEQSHIPTAFYADLNNDLSGKILPGITSRHPLPNLESFAQTLSRWGIDTQSQVVVYDDHNGSIASRL